MGSWINETKIRCPLCSKYLYEHGVDTGGPISWLACHECGVYNGYSQVHSFMEFPFDKNIFGTEDVKDAVEIHLDTIDCMIKREYESEKETKKYLEEYVQSLNEKKKELRHKLKRYLKGVKE